ncbi:hypothetical protein [Terribacillus saccharophilus]|uniref:Phage protein n=1 Tax=Terribacillus saccharophilus TaxID=361277 RepID=A0AAX2EDN1_9BACI|nr:hypothetical protein [Terribacillus goriensis]SEM86562.1 hypothetical protein SAMN04489762_1239 [Terribacillus saccharophilus]
MIRSEMYLEYLQVRQEIIKDLLEGDTLPEIEQSLEQDYRIKMFSSEERTMFEEMYLDYTFLINGYYPLFEED